MTRARKSFNKRVSDWIMRVPAGIVEDPKEFLIALALGFVGLVQFLLPAILEPGAFAGFYLPLWIIIIWGVFFFAGGGMTAAGTVLRGRVGMAHVPRTVESVGLTMLSTATISYTVVAAMHMQDTGGIGNVLLLLAIGLGLGLRAVIMTPGIYERLLRRELDREVKRITER